MNYTTLPKIGDKAPGGIVGGIMLAEGERPAYLIIVAEAPAGEAARLAWGGYGKAIEGLSDWDGPTNTQKLAAAESGHPAAQFCAALSIDGFSDFYLPSRQEALLLSAMAPTLFSGGWHWTSTQYSSSGAFVQYFNDGYQHGNGKFYEGRVRAVRRVVIPVGGRHAATN